MAQPGLVQIDSTAAGYGWFVDPTPSTNVAFGQFVANTELQALADATANHMDLLSIVMHELGHELGLPDLDPATHPYDLMAEQFDLGVRKLPEAQSALPSVIPSSFHLPSTAAPGQPSETSAATDAVFSGQAAPDR